MEIIDIAITTGDWLIPGLIALGIVVVVGIIVGLYDEDIAGFFAVLVIGLIPIAILSVAGWGIASDNRLNDGIAAFEAAYGVTILNGYVPPADPNESRALQMFTQDGGPKACLVTTDDVKYTVVCDGKTLEVLN